MGVAKLAKIRRHFDDLASTWDIGLNQNHRLTRVDGYMEDDLMEIDLKSIFRAISSLENCIMI